MLFLSYGLIIPIISCEICELVTKEIFPQKKQPVSTTEKFKGSQQELLFC